MSKQKFHALLILGMMIFLALCAGGCGGGSSDSAPQDDDPTPTPMVSPDPKPIISPDPEPTPVPVAPIVPPGLTPKPAPSPIILPDPEPVPITSPDPSPDPTPVPAPIVSPDPVPVVSPDPTPIISPDPAPIISPDPEPEPEPEPEPAPEPLSYIVRFNSNGGSTVESVTVVAGGTVAKPRNPTKEGYIFNGWYKDKWFIDIFTFGANGDKIMWHTTLYAQWLKIDLSIDIPIDEAHFPDAKFRECVESFDMDNNGLLSEAEIAKITRVVADNKQISSLQGIEYFTSLDYLNCNNNELAALDVSKNTALKHLYCEHNQLTTLDVSNNIALLDLNCCYNQLTALDVSNNTSLITLQCLSNQLTTLDVSKNVALKLLICASNQLTVLDVSNNAALETLECHHNQFTILDLSKNTALTELYCNNNQLTTLDLSYCPNLNSDNVQCDDWVTITWYSATTSRDSAFAASPSASLTAKDSPEVLAVLPAFTPEQSGTYSFTVSLDSTPPEGSYLVLLSDSEDIHGSFTLIDSHDTVIVSADFMAGRTYAPVIAAKSNPNTQGGCNAGTAGMLLLAGTVVIFVGRRFRF